MCAHVIGVVRSAQRLDTLTFEARDPSDRAFPWRVEHVCELRPLPQSSHLWPAWRALEAVTRWDETTLAHVLAILRATVPCLDTPADLPALEAPTPTEPRATAAHPRAFRGTKYRPPRSQQPEAIDVRPYLLTRRHTDQALERLGQPRGIDPYVAWNHGVESASFDPTFVMLLPLFRACSWSEVGAFASLARTLQLHLQPELRAALIGVYLAADDPARALGWWSHVLAHEVEQRLEVARLVAISGVAKLPPIEPTGLQPEQQWSFFRGLVAGASPVYLASGLQLGALADVEQPAPGTSDVTALVQATVERLAVPMTKDSGLAFWRRNLWRLCGYQPEMIELLGSPGFVALTPEAAYWLLRVANSPRWVPETAAAEWRELAPVLPRIVEIAAGASPAYQRKFVEDVSDVYWTALDDHDITDALARCVDRCLRIARPPFGTKASLGGILFLMLTHGDDAIRDAPDASWLALEDACKRDNQTRLLGRGLDRLSKFAPKLLASTFSTTPAAVLQTADLLAAISFEAAQELLAAYVKSPIADPALAEAPLERLCEVIEPIARAGGPNPVRRALRLHFAGQPLNDAQLRGHRDRIVVDLGIIRLAAVRQAVERVLAARVGIEKIESSTVRHALAMLDGVDIHRRQLRRMLTASLSGDRGWRLRHPRTAQWFARHPKLDREAWLAGIETRGEVPEVGELRIAIETDPLEALKLGTYVGSCLGRGGNLEYSAAAVVLDVNKQVVYARDRHDTVVGRQLVCLSEAEELVCFGVYGPAHQSIQPLFRAFDQAFASKLGVPVFKGTDYTIAHILSHHWWDDSAWCE